MRTIKNFIVLALFVLITTACAQQKALPEMSVKQLKTAIKNDTSLVILDVRTPQELEGPLGQIDGVVNIPIQELESRINELDKYKDRPIAVICRTGHRSSKGTEILLEHGFKATNVEGGMTKFRADK